jgi:hypothetical protein
VRVLRSLVGRRTAPTLSRRAALHAAMMRQMRARLGRPPASWVNGWRVGLPPMADDLLPPEARTMDQPATRTEAREVRRG